MCEYNCLFRCKLRKFVKSQSKTGGHQTADIDNGPQVSGPYFKREGWDGIIENVKESVDKIHCSSKLLPITIALTNLRKNLFGHLK